MDLSILHVIEMNTFVVIVSHDDMPDLSKCKFPCYRFVNNNLGAYDACEDIALRRGKKIADMFYGTPEDPQIYEPCKETGQYKKSIAIVKEPIKPIDIRLRNIMA